MEAIGRDVLSDEQASANYRMREVRLRRTGEVGWEVVDANTAAVVATGLSSRNEALRAVRSLERLNARLDNGLEGHVRVH